MSGEGAGTDPDGVALARAYFESFAAAFATFDGSEVARLFAAPVVALRSDGALVALPDHAEVVRYYQAALDRYRDNGCQSCRWLDLSVTPMGRGALLAAVTWELLRQDGTVATRWRQSYALSLFGDATPRAFSCVSHATG